MFGNTRLCGGCTFNDVQRLNQVGMIGNLYIERLLQFAAGIRFVDHHRGNERLVRNQRLRTVGIAQHDKTRGNFGDIAGKVIDRQTVVHADGAVAQNDEA